MSGVARLALFAVPGLPLFAEGDPLGTLILDALERAELPLEDGDVVVITSKALSRVEGCFVDLSTVAPSEQARALGAEIGKDPAMVELILRDTERISRQAP